MFKIPIERYGPESEIDKAIAGLEKRGFKLLSKKATEYVRKEFNKKGKFTHTTENRSWKAIMVKEKQA